MPVSSQSVQTLDTLLKAFKSTPSPHFKQLVLLFSDDLISKSYLNILKEDQRHVNSHFSFNIQSIPATGDSHTQVLQQASDAPTDWVLILDENGIDETTLETLRGDILFSPKSHDLGSHSFLNKSGWPDPYDLKPPLLLSTSSLKTFISPQPLKVYMPSQDDIVFLLPDFETIQSASHLVCGLLSQKYILRVLVYDRQSLLSTAFWPTWRPNLNGCLKQLIIHQADLSWFNQPAFTPLILFSTQEDKPFLEGLLSTKTNTTRIYIPTDQYPYTDWIGSLSISELQNWHIPKLTLSVITHSRPHSLNRLLTSLSSPSALYFGDDDTNLINIRLNVDSPIDPETRHLIQTFSWPRGPPVQIHQRIIHGGLMAAIVESWYPHGNHSYGLLLEDDVELSPLFYAWIKMSILKYRYGDKSNTSPNLFGISLYQQKHLELLPNGRRPFNARTLFSSHPSLFPTNSPYLSSIPCSWGAVYFPEHWREFHDYLSQRLKDDQDVNPVVPDVRSNKWSHSWKKYFIELVYLRGYVMLYPNYADFVSLSTNHLEAGSHVRGKISPEKRGLFVLPLMQLSSDDGSPSTGLLDLPTRRLPNFGDLPVLNLTGSLTTLESLIETGYNRTQSLVAL